MVGGVQWQKYGEKFPGPTLNGRAQFTLNRKRHRILTTDFPSSSEQFNKLWEKRIRKCSPSCSDSCTIHPVQQGDVSSTEHHLLEPTLNGQHNAELIAQRGALEHYISTFGWAILQINSDGIIETVSDSIKDLIQYTSADLLKQPIYSYLHPSDQAKLSPLLNNNMSFANWDRQDDGPTVNGKRNIQKRIRMRVKYPETANETMEQKQQRQENYEEFVMYATTPFNKGKVASWSGSRAHPFPHCVTHPIHPFTLCHSSHSMHSAQITERTSTAHRFSA